MSYSQRAAVAASNSNIYTGIIGVPKIVDESPEVVIDKESYSEGETDPLED